MNATTVAEILASLEGECLDKFPRSPKKRSICDEIAEVFVQIPPGIFKGLESLAWPVPLGVCASIFRCDTVCCASDAGPEQIHLSLPGNGDGSRMGVTWVDLEGPSSVVEWRVGNGNGTLLGANYGTVSTYHWGSWVGTIHMAVIGSDTLPLEADGRYEYRVSDGSGTEATLWSVWIPFKTLPPASAFQVDPTKALNFAIIGDMGYAEKSDATVSNLISLVDQGLIDAVVHSGDISYADGFMPHW
jgi:hypothetical protein